MDFSTLPGSLTSLQMLLGSDEKENSKSSCHLENKQSVPWQEKLSQFTKEWPGKSRFTEITRKLMASWRPQSSRLHYNELNFLFIHLRNKYVQVPTMHQVMCPMLNALKLHGNPRIGIISLFFTKEEKLYSQKKKKMNGYYMPDPDVDSY